MTKINPKEEFLKRVKKMKFVDGKRSIKNDFNSMSGDFLNQEEPVKKNITFNDLVDKVEKLLKNQEVIIDLLLSENKIVPKEPIEKPDKLKGRKVYKNKVDSEQNVEVGFIIYSKCMELYPPKKNEFISSLNVYTPEWWTKDDDGFYLRYEPENEVKQIFTTIGTPQDYLEDNNKYCVTGYLTNDGRAIYYDQYL